MSDLCDEDIEEALKIDITRPTSAEYMFTYSGNKVSWTAKIHGLRNIQLLGNCIIHGGVEIHAERATIRMGKFTIINPGCLMSSETPDESQESGICIGNYVNVGRNSKISTGTLGNHVYISENCELGPGVEIRDQVYVMENSHILPYTVLPPLSVYGGRPVSKIGEVHPGFSYMMQSHLEDEFERLQEA